jgi:hypothetical protein
MEDESKNKDVSKDKQPLEDTQDFLDMCDEDCAEQEGKLIYSGALFNNEKSH